MWNAFEPKTTMEYDFVDYDNVDPKMLEMQEALYRQIMLDTLIGRGDDGMAEYWDLVRDRMTFHGTGDNNTSVFVDKPKLPQKICNYRKPKVYWFGELHGSNNLYHNPDFTMTRHWEVLGDRVEPFRGKRFIGISEPDESEKIDNDFPKRFTGDEWVETRTLSTEEFKWTPQGEIFIMSGKPLKINEKDKDTVEQVERISYPPAE